MNQRSWINAEGECEQDGAHLVVIDDDAENEAIPGIDVWIGYSERVTPGFFRWVTDAIPLFSAWASGEPVFGGNACVSKRSDGWHDEACDNTRRFICEYDGLPANPAHF